MPLSTSSSDDRLPAGPWRKTWVVALVGTLLLLGGWEAHWRWRGYHPEPSDSAELWAMSMRRVGPESTVLLGTSRIRADIDLDVMGEAFGRDVVQLGINATAPIPILEHLAEDASYRGMVIVDLIPEQLFSEMGVFDEDAIAYLNQLREDVSPAKAMESKLARPLREALAFRNSSLSIRSLLWSQVTGQNRDPGARRLDHERREYLDFSKIDLAKKRPPSARNIERANAKSATDIRPVVERIERAVRKLQARGCIVILVRMPYRADDVIPESGRYPRDRYWNVLAAASGAIVIHSDDDESLAAFTCPDRSHLDYHDAAPFTRALVEIIKARIDEARD
ncbi:MAG TPA: hypothetical protein P5081_07105 [Phycisphaerae bacterium]|nr:hypothetical protein [Phycisphaerae bacterium]HRW52638.1 hypothetical protein [Phycisphaerae bacterium]